MATYVNDLRLKEIGTGESSGTWGSETNVNLELIGEALGFGTEAITTNADTHTTTVADGSTDPGRAMYLKYTGTLDSACTITIAPNTMSRMHFIENGTSGSQNIIISQGTGANVTIPAGDTKAVYLDGAGSGAAVVDAFASLSTVDLKVQDDLTVTDDVSIGGALTLTGNGDFNGDLDVDGTTNLDVVDIDGAVDMASTLQVDGAITSSAGATITLADNTDNLTLTTTDADASVGPNLRMYRNSGSPADNDLVGAIDFEGRNDNSQDVVYSQIFTQILDASDGTEDGYLSFKVMNAGTSRQRLLFDAGETVFNDESQDVDLRVESNGDANMFIVDAGNDRVGIGTGTPGFTFDLQKSLSESYSASGRPTALARVFNTNTADNNHATIEFGTEPSSGNGGVGFIGSTVTASNLADLFFGTRTGASAFATHMTIKSGGDVRIGTSTSAYTFAEKLIVGDANDNDGITIQSGSTHQGNIAFNDGGTTAKGRISYQQSTNFFEFLVNNAVRLKIDTNGRQAYNGSGTINAHATFVGEVGSGFKALAFERTVGGGEVGTIVANASSTTYNTSSDYRLKENVDYSWDATTRLKQLKPARFNWIIDETNTLVDGFLAHEVSSIVPEAISGEKDAMGEALLYEHGDEIPEGKSVGDVKKASAPEYQGIDHSKLVPLLVKTIQELEARVTTLEG
jgi:hypothetical protein